MVDVSGPSSPPASSTSTPTSTRFRPRPASYCREHECRCAPVRLRRDHHGGCGHGRLEEFLRFQRSAVIDRSKVRILAFLNIASEGMVDAESEQNVAGLHPKIAAAVAAGLPGDDRRDQDGPLLDRAALGRARTSPGLRSSGRSKPGELCGMPVMVDFWPRPPERPYPDLILKKLRPGDIHTHVFAQQFPILDQDGKVNDFLFEARERGVHLRPGPRRGQFLVPQRRAGLPRRLPARLRSAPTCTWATSTARWSACCTPCRNS